MTRRQQFNLRRAKYGRKLQAMYRRGHAYTYIPPSFAYPYGQHLRAGRSTPIWHAGAKQLTDRVKHGPKPYTPGLPFPLPFTFAVSPIGYKLVPHVSLTGAAAAARDAQPNRHLNQAAVGYHGRRRFYIGKKPDRMNGFQRKCWGAAHVAYSQGYFPDWDPLGRHPTESDVALGAPSYAGPFPQTP